jgi:ribosome-binding protein aMBF1 (putative translation factor)
MARSRSEFIDVNDLLAEDLKDPEFRAEWERLAAARAVAELIATSRESKGLTQTALGRAIGVRQPVIARIESGDHEPTIATLIKIVNALDIELMLGITPATRAISSIAKKPKGAKVAEEVVAALGARLVVAAS